MFSFFIHKVCSRPPVSTSVVFVASFVTMNDAFSVCRYCGRMHMSESLYIQYVSYVI